MDLEKTYAINERDVLAESVDGELIVINLNSGAYYSSDGVGEEVWRRLAVGHATPAQVLDSLSELCGLPEDSIRDDVIAFMDLLLTEDLIVAAEAPAGIEMPAAAASAIVYTPPLLNKYTDFEDLLKLDPIHEVHEAAGWPVVKPIG